jgi:hypothetical protein
MYSEEHYWATILNTHNRNFGFNLKPTHPNNKSLISSETRDKLRVWDSGEYTIGFKNGYSFGHIGSGEYAMSFQMNNNSSRGFWWGDTAHNDAQGAAALTTDGRMNIARSLSIGEGESATEPSSTPLYVRGITDNSEVLAVDGVNGRLFTVTDSVLDTIYSVNTIAGLPILEILANSTVKIGKYGSNSITINATGASLNSTANTVYIAPIASSANTSNVLIYNTTTKEVNYNTTKSFVIEHPTKSDNYLVHACLEGPESGIYYRGTSEIQEEQECTTINLPDYVSSFATDFTITLTPIYNGKITTLSASEVNNNSFRVYGDSPCKFYWYVYAKREDIIVEPLKQGVSVKGDGPYKYIQ